MPSTRRKNHPLTERELSPRKRKPVRDPRPLLLVDLLRTASSQELLHELLTLKYAELDLPDEEVVRQVELGLRLLGFRRDKEDPITKRAHYNQSRMEVIEIADDHRLDMYRFTVLKYLLRAPHTTNVLEQLQKAKYYLDRLTRLTSLGKGPLGHLVVQNGEEAR